MYAFGLQDGGASAVILTASETGKIRKNGKRREAGHNDGAPGSFQVLPANLTGIRRALANTVYNTSVQIAVRVPCAEPMAHRASIFHRIVGKIPAVTSRPCHIIILW
jgi:hypothetical protein